MTIIYVLSVIIMVDGFPAIGPRLEFESRMKCEKVAALLRHVAANKIRANCIRLGGV